MKYYHQSKGYLIAFTLIFLTLASNAQDEKNFRFGLQFSPNIGWMRADSKNFDAGKSKLGYSYGLIGDFRLGNSASFNIGFSITSLNHGIIVDSITTKPTDKVPISKTFYEVTYDYKTKYMQIPLTLKLRTNEIGYITYYGEFGFEPSFVYRVKADVDPDIFGDPEQSNDRGVNDDGEDFAGANFKEDNVISIRGSLIVGAGIEYKLSGNTSFMAGIRFDNGLTNTLSADGTKGFNNYIALNLGVMF